MEVVRCHISVPNIETAVLMFPGDRLICAELTVVDIVDSLSFVGCIVASEIQFV